MKRNILLALLFLSLLLAVGSAAAQFAQRGGLAGTVYDASGAVLPGAQLTLLDVAQNQTRVFTADKTGHFEFDNLAAGQYKLTASHEGFQTIASDLITVNISAISN